MADFLKDFIPIIIVGLSLGSLFGLVGVSFTVIINASQLVRVFSAARFGWHFLQA